MSKTLTDQPFTYSYYRKMLETVQNKGFKVTSFNDFKSTQQKTIIMRHDVDYTVDGVLDIANVEYDLGITSTFLFRIHADQYNPFSCINYQIIKNLEKMGHEIGLHYEAMNVGRATGVNPVDLLKREKQILESILGHSVDTCSEHRELSGTIHNTPLYESLYNPLDAGFKTYAMDPKYTKEMKYLSDSNAHWREGDLYQHIDKHSRFQILIHPDWWFETDLLLKGAYVHPRGTHP